MLSTLIQGKQRRANRADYLAQSVINFLQGTMSTNKGFFINPQHCHASCHFRKATSHLYIILLQSVYKSLKCMQKERQLSKYKEQTTIVVPQPHTALVSEKSFPTKLLK